MVLVHLGTLLYRPHGWHFPFLFLCPLYSKDETVSRVCTRLLKTHSSQSLKQASILTKNIILCPNHQHLYDRIIIFSIMGWQDWLFCYLLLQSVQAATLPWRIWPATLITHDSRPPAIDWTRCDRDFDDELLNRLQRSFDCARVPVPLDYTNEYSSQPLLLDLVRVNANRHPYKGSVIFNPGGPGGSGVSYVILKGGMLRKFIGGHYDIIGFDPR